jgi:ABC-2 type transport system permease protein
MAKIGHICWKELKTYFTSWIAYAILAGWTFIGGLTFFLLLSAAASPGSGSFQIEPIFSNLVVMLIFIVPILTMRLLAEERKENTIELLFTSPLTEWQVTLGKFLGVWAFVGLMILLTSHFPLFSAKYGTMDFGPIWGCYLALLLVGAAAAAFGLLCSSLTESQVVAGFLAFGGLLVSWMLSWLGQRLGGQSDLIAFISQWSIYSHFERMMQGAIDTKDVIFFVSCVALFLFATVRVLESRKWR